MQQLKYFIRRKTKGTPEGKQGRKKEKERKLKSGSKLIIINNINE